MSRLTWLWIIAVGSFLGLWDYWRYSTKGDPGTISGTLFYTASVFPLFALVFVVAEGVLAGHLFGNLFGGKEAWPTVMYLVLFAIGLAFGYRIAVTS